jgi:hypothetical protein
MQWAAGSDTEGSEELASLQAGFPQFRIWREVICNRARYNARSLHRGTHPHTVVTAGGWAAITTTPPTGPSPTP